MMFPSEPTRSRNLTQGRFDVEVISLLRDASGSLSKALLGERGGAAFVKASWN